MSRLLSRILLTILLFPSATLLLFISFIFYDHLIDSSDSDGLIAGSLITSVYMVLYWLALWWRSVVWTPRRVRWTLAAGGGACVVGIALGVAIFAMFNGRYDRFLGPMFGSLTAAVAWIIGTIFAWRETPSERAARVTRSAPQALVCPTCGYNLTGLSEARCPECGTRFTIDELIASQPQRETSAAEIA